MEMENPENIRTFCKDCRKKVFPDAGKFTKEDVKVGQFVKKAFGEKNIEHMWVQVKEKTEKSVVGTLDNIPCFTDEKVKFGDVIEIHYEDIEDALRVNSPFWRSK